MKRPARADAPSARQRRIAQRTALLPPTSRILYRIEHYTSLPRVSLTIVAAVAGLVAVGAVLGFSSGWVTTFEVAVSSITLLMVFAIQHTQGREQAATQRKLDELLRALPNANDSFMMLEEAAPATLLDIEEEQRATSAESNGETESRDDS